jgi:hypothetical protein
MIDDNLSLRCKHISMHIFVNNKIFIDIQNLSTETWKLLLKSGKRSLSSASKKRTDEFGVHDFSTRYLSDFHC